MHFLEVLELYDLISRGTKDVPSRKVSMHLRKSGIDSAVNERGFKKLAFDTRRIDQETAFIPRRGLQNYNRSESFLSEAMSQKVQNFNKLRSALTGLKEVYGKEPEWQDSNARVLLNTVENSLRISTNDGDFTEHQPGVGSFDYLEELLHVRYRLAFDDLVRLGEIDLQKVILKKDEELTRKNANSLEITKKDVITKGYDSLIEKLFEGCKASADNPDVERTITITIRDKFHKES